MNTNRDLRNPVPEMFTLPSGLRCVCCMFPDARVEYFGVAVDAGSRDDPADGHGLAHFVEHTIFKGTGRRRAWHIINRMESCGGELNAYTTKESTTVYSIFPAGNLRRAADLIADLVIDSRFPRNELDREREVVADEISSYLDVPSDAVYDDFEDRLFAGTPLGHNILGTQQTLAYFTPEACRRWLSDFYVASNMVVFYSGPVDPAKVGRIVGQAFAPLSVAPPANDTTVTPPGHRFRECVGMGIHQAHTIIGTTVCDMFSDDRFALSVLVNLLGGPGMNSLLNVEMRERRGLVYSVDASLSLLTDTGVMAIYFGCDPEDIGRCTRIVDKVIGRLCSTPLSDRTFERMMRQHIGQMSVAADNRENSILSMARSALYRHQVGTVEQTAARLRQLTPDSLMRAARMIAPETLSSLTFC